MGEWYKLPAVAQTWPAFKATLLAEQKSERDNVVAPASAYTNNAHGGADAEALNNLSAATDAYLQAAANQAVAVANLVGTNQKLAHQLQQVQQKIQKMMENIHLPGTSQARSYQPHLQKPAPVAAHIRITPIPTPLNQGEPSRFHGNQPLRAARRWKNDS